MSQLTAPSAAPKSRDEATASVVDQMHRLNGHVALGIAGPLALWIIWAFFSAGIGSGIFVFFLSIFLFFVLVSVASYVILIPVEAIRFGACLKRMKAMLPALGFTPALQWTWKTPGPGLCAIDSQRRLIFLECGGTSYYPLLIHPKQVINAKVERETELRTETKNSGSFSVFSKGGVGYNLGSKSTSNTTVVERAFLELHCVIAANGAPCTFVIPFGDDRRQADSMAVAIMHMKGLERH